MFIYKRAEVLQCFIFGYIEFMKKKASEKISFTNEPDG